MPWIRSLLPALVMTALLSGRAGADTAVSMRINEILADPPPGLAGDANGDGTRDSSDDEFVELVNAGPEPVDIAGWAISDSSEVRHVFPDSLPIVVLPGGIVTVFGGGTPTGIGGLVFTASTGRLSLNNDSDVVMLTNAGGAAVDRHAYGSEGGRDRSLVRAPDGTGDWFLAGDQGTLTPFSPGHWNGGATPVIPETWGALKARSSR